VVASSLHVPPVFRYPGRLLGSVGTCVSRLLTTRPRE